MKLKKSGLSSLRLKIDYVGASLGRQRCPIPEDLVSEFVEDKELLKEIIGTMIWRTMRQDAIEGGVPDFSTSVTDDCLEIDFEKEVTQDDVNNLMFYVNWYLDRRDGQEPIYQLSCNADNGSWLPFQVWGVTLAPEG